MSQQYQKQKEKWFKAGQNSKDEEWRGKIKNTFNKVYFCISECNEDCKISQAEMVEEYAKEIIRNLLSNKSEKKKEVKNGRV